MSTTISVFLDKRRELESGEYPVKLVIYLDRKQYTIGTPIRAKETVYLKYKTDMHHTTSSRELKEEIKKELGKAEAIIEDTRNLTIEKFKKLYQSEAGIVRRSNKTFLKYHYDAKIDDLREQESYGTAMTYKNSYDSLNKYNVKALKRPEDSLAIEDITPHWLLKYQTWLLNKGCSISTCGCYTRHLKAIFKICGEEGFVGTANNPFKGKDGYKPAPAVGTKRGLTLEQVEQLRTFRDFGYDAVQAWLFSYYCNGCNPIDILEMHQRNIDGDYLVFQRTKTKKKLGQKIKAKFRDELKEICVNNINEDGYLFGVFTKGMTTEDKYKACSAFKRNMTKTLTEIAEALGWSGTLNIAMARVTWASVQRNKGTAVTHISRGLGHTTTGTTENYLNSLDNEYVDAMSDNLGAPSTGLNADSIKRMDDLLRSTNISDQF